MHACERACVHAWVGVLVVVLVVVGGGGRCGWPCHCSLCIVPTSSDDLRGVSGIPGTPETCLFGAEGAGECHKKLRLGVHEISPNSVGNDSSLERPFSADSPKRPALQNLGPAPRNKDICLFVCLWKTKVQQLGRGSTKLGPHSTNSGVGVAIPV